MTEQEMRKNIKNRLRLLLVESDKTQCEVSKESGINLKLFNAQVAGKVMPGNKNLCAICDYFDVSIDWLMGRTDKREINK